MEQMPVKLLNEWLAFSEIEPFGPLVDARRAALIAAAPYNTAFGRSKNAKIIKPEDLCPELRKPMPKQTSKEMAEQLRSMAISMGGVVRKKGEAEPEKVKAEKVKKPALVKEKPNRNRKGKG